MSEPAPQGGPKGIRMSEELTIRAIAGEDEVRQCAELMTSSEPRITLGRTMEHPIQLDFRQVPLCVHFDHGFAIGRNLTFPAIDFGRTCTSNNLSNPSQIQVLPGHLDILLLNPLESFCPQDIQISCSRFKGDVEF